MVTTPGGTPRAITQNGFLNYLSGYANGSGQASVISGVLGGEIQITERLRADVGGRVEYDNYVQSSENTSTFDLDGESDHDVQQRDLRQQQLPPLRPGHHGLVGVARPQLLAPTNLSLYASGARGYKMPALDEFLNAHGAGAGGPVRRRGGASRSRAA